MSTSSDVVYRAERAYVDGGIRSADVCVVDGRIAAIAPSGTIASDRIRHVPPGCTLLPGVVDAHVHVNEPGRTEWEGFATATEAAIRGGVTTIVDMPLNSIPPTTDPDALGVKRASATGRVHTDTAFWGGAVPANRGRLHALRDAGVLGFKCFLVDSGVPEFPALDAAMFGAAMAEVASLGALMLVHAEDPAVIEAHGSWSSARYTDFVASRPELAEVVAIQRVIEAVRHHGTRTHVLHLSSARALDAIAAARAEGLPLTVETCPHYLVFDADSIPDGAAEFKCCPPIRDAGNREALWDALAEGIIDAVVSDHSPSTIAEKRRGGGDLRQAWGGISGIEVGFRVVADDAQRRGHDLGRVSSWMSTAPASIAGLTSKGAIAVGLDADLIVYEPSGDHVIDPVALAHRNPISAYAGRPVRGRVLSTMLRGHEVYDGVTVAPPRGTLLTPP
jgi:allantoinase